jgi:redox-sensitive bicupin YhaK (pirin superfamily)
MNLKEFTKSRRGVIFGFAALTMGWILRNLKIATLENGDIMLQLRKSEERGFADHGWLKSRHTFSFAEYYDPKHMGFKSLRVINEDRIDGGTGFGTHPHKDMEIISYVVKGGLEHKDSMGTKAVILPGEVQRMSAGSGVAHSENNHLPDQQSHFFQIWIMPNQKGGTPGYGQKSFEKDLNSKKMVLVVSQDGRDGSIEIKQDADLYISRLKKGDNLEFSVRPNRGVWVQVLKGQLTVNNKEVSSGDAVSLTEENLLKVTASEDSELMLFDLV